MSGRHQPLNGADSAQGLADAIALVEAYGLERFDPSKPCDCHATYEGGVHGIDCVQRCIACSEPALPESPYCAGHDRLGTYTDHESAGGIAAND